MRPWGVFVVGLAAAACGGSEAPLVAASEGPHQPTPRASVSASAPASASAAAASTPATAPPKKARYVAHRFAPLPDGRRIAIHAGRRVILEGETTKIVDAAPVDDLEQVLHLTDPFGGGYLFLGSHTVRFSPAVDGPLIEVATVQPGSNLDVGVGWSQVLVKSARDKPAMHDLASGRVVAPPVPGLVQLLAHPSGYVVARTSAGALFVSKDRGPFKRVKAPPAKSLIFDGQTPLAEMDVGYLGVAATGEASPAEACGGCTIIASSAHTFLDPYPVHSQLQEKPEEIVAFAPRFDDATPIRVSGRNVEIFDGATGARVKVWKKAFDVAASCRLVREGKPSFVACLAQPTVVYRLDALEAPPVEEIRVRSLPFSEEVGNSRDTVRFPLAFPGACDARPGFRGFCARKAGAWVDVPSPPDPGGLLDQVRLVAKIATSKDGDPLLFAYLRHETDDVTIFDGANGRIRKVRLEGAASSWSSKEIDVDGEVIRVLGADDELHIGPDDVARTKKRDRRIAVHGKRGLRSNPDGTLVETDDGGRTWHPVDPPPDRLPLDRVRCGSGGCEVGPWLRLGWSR
jgi:hypothetical protein